MSLHSFDPEVAAIVGVVPAVIFQNLKFWIVKNASSGEHHHEGRFWTYNSIRGYRNLFPYLSEKQIRGALETLEEKGLIGSGNFNRSAYDRTKWYCLLRQIDLPSWANGNAPGGEPIPDSKPDIKPDSKHAGACEDEQLTLLSEEPQAEKPDQFEAFWKVYPKKAGKPAARKAWAKATKKHDPQTIIAAAAVYAKSETVERGFAKHPQGWLNDERFLDPDLQPPKPGPVIRAGDVDWAARAQQFSMKGDF